MTFLTPLFLLGAAGVALPILFHLIRSTTREVTPFPSLMFLQPTPPRITSRSRVQDLLLLLLRMLALLLIAAAFARPFWPKVKALPPASGSVKRSVILVDCSASMRREGLWPQALALAEKALREREDQAETAVLVFDREVRVLADFKAWAEAAEGARTARVLPTLQSLTPTWAGTALGPALLRAADLLGASAKEEQIDREIVLISDAQEGSHVEGLQGYEWPKGTHLTLLRVNPKPGTNAGLQWLTGTDAAEGSPEDEKSLRVRVSNAPGGTAEQFELRWAEVPNASAVAAYVPVGQSRTVRVPWPAGGKSGQLVLTGDDVPFDNAINVAPVQAQNVKVLFAGADKPDDARQSLYFLQRAFPKTRLQNVEVLARPADAEVARWELDAARLLVLGSGAAGNAVESARHFAESGKLVLAPIASAAEGAPMLTSLLGHAPAGLSEAVVRDYAILGQIDFRHPFFLSFADPRFSDFSKIHFWKYRKLDVSSWPGANVIARFDSGDPALVQVPVGKGSVLLLTTTWRPADSQFALSSKFIPLLQAILEGSGGANVVTKAQYFVGDEIPVATGTNFKSPEAPGFYTVSPGPVVVPVNLDPAESRTAPMRDEQWAALGLPLSAKAAAEKDAASPEQALRREATEEESRQKLWQWILLAAVLLLFAETALAGRTKTSHTVAAPAAATTTPAS